MASTLQLMDLLDSPRSPLKAFVLIFLRKTVIFNGYNRIKKVF